MLHATYAGPGTEEVPRIGKPCHSLGAPAVIKIYGKFAPCLLQANILSAATQSQPCSHS